MKDRISSSGSILDFVPLNETAFDHFALMLPWFQTCIGLNNIEHFTPDGLFEEGNVIKGVKKNDDIIWMPYHSKDTFYGRPPLQW